VCVIRYRILGLKFQEAYDYNKIRRDKIPFYF